MLPDWPAACLACLEQCLNKQRCGARRANLYFGNDPFYGNMALAPRREALYPCAPEACVVLCRITRTPITSQLGQPHQVWVAVHREDIANPLGAQESCFSVAPRWLGPPSEVVANYAAQDKAGPLRLNPNGLTVTHLTMATRVFSTAWVRHISADVARAQGLQCMCACSMSQSLIALLRCGNAGSYNILQAHEALTHKYGHVASVWGAHMVCAHALHWDSDEGVLRDCECCVQLDYQLGLKDATASFNEFLVFTYTITDVDDGA